MKITEFLKDDTGALSSNRLVFLLGWFAFLVTWINQCIHESKVVAIDNSVVYLLVVLAGQKVGQSITENIKPPELKNKE